ncbi:DoxX family protein [Rhizohabitans arisaemae]|uniref:DoxX family protein n=1 Tax=Rhizohabitans arisaemae TaxID=2720610 RepID=UPI0024B0AF96|nr:DoxX family protein [Rhizohabitans arisaemae]
MCAPQSCTANCGHGPSPSPTRCSAAVKAIGVLEILAAVGLILPAVVDVAPVPVPMTALCWVLLMIGAMTTHARRGEFRFAMLNLICLALAAFIVWGRFGAWSFTG